MSLYTPTCFDKAIGWSSFALCVALLLGGVFYGLPRDVAKFADRGASAIPGLVLGIIILFCLAWMARDSWRIATGNVPRRASR